MTTTQPCVSLGTGALSPDLRVFYHYGMVLGLDDFVQEQVHNLFLDHHHERALHGYGTVYGLRVTAGRPVDNQSDVTITVDPGMAVDQWGREITITCAQCARLGAWLAAQDQATVEENLGPSGELVLYVTAVYSDCPEDLVPVPGQPCSTSSQSQVASRLRDAWDIEFRWSPPAMPEWEAIGKLARLLNSVQIVPGLSPADSSEEAIVEAVRALAWSGQPSESPSGPSDWSWLPSEYYDPSSSPVVAPTYQLPAVSAGDAFNHVFGVWVTEVRPRVSLHLSGDRHGSDPSILLSTIAFTPQTPFSTTSPEIVSYEPPHDAGRPFLLSTGLIQELRFGGEAAAPIVEEAVTLGATATTDGVPTLSAWFHLGAPVSLPETVQVTDETSGATASFATGSSGISPIFQEVWTLSPPSEPFLVENGDLLSATFPGASVLVGEDGDYLATALSSQCWLNADAHGDLTAYTEVLVPVVPSPPPLSSTIASVPFVTVSYVPNALPLPSPLPSELEPLTKIWDELSGYIELWFHLDPEGPEELATVAEPYIELIGVDSTAGGAANFPSLETHINDGETEVIGGMVPTFQTFGPLMRGAALLQEESQRALLMALNPDKSNIWKVPVQIVEENGPVYLRLLFSIETPITTQTSPAVNDVAGWISENLTRYCYIGWDGDSIVTFARIAGSNAGAPPEWGYVSG